MKNFKPILFSGLVGGLVVLLGLVVFTKFYPQEKIVIVEQDKQPIRKTSMTSAAPVDFRIAAREASPSVVLIKAKESALQAQERYREQYSSNPFSRFFDFGDMNYGPRMGSGSGVIMSEDGYIVTNNHVIDFADEFLVTLNDGREYEGVLVGRSTDADIAVLKITADNLDPISLGSSDRAEVGEWVLAIGNPFELTNTATAGIISAKGRDIGLQRGGDGISAFIQTDAAVNSGNSGGALVNQEGELIGINTAIFTRNGGYVGYSFAIPVEIVGQVYEEILEKGTSGKGYLGVTIAEVDEQVQRQLNLGVSRGVYIYDTQRGGAALAAGIRPLDVILEVNGENVRTVSELQQTLKDRQAGDEVLFTINRFGEKLKIPVRLLPRQY